MGAAKRVSPLIYPPFSFTPLFLSPIVPRLFLSLSCLVRTHAPSIPYKYDTDLSLPFSRKSASLALSTVFISPVLLYFSFTNQRNEAERNPQQPLPVHKRRVKQINNSTLHGGDDGDGDAGCCCWVHRAGSTSIFQQRRG